MVYNQWIENNYVCFFKKVISLPSIKIFTLRLISLPSIKIITLGSIKTNNKSIINKSNYFKINKTKNSYFKINKKPK